MMQFIKLGKAVRREKIKIFVKDHTVALSIIGVCLLIGLISLVFWSCSQIVDAAH